MIHRRWRMHEVSWMKLYRNVPRDDRTQIVRMTPLEAWFSRFCRLDGSDYSLG